MTNIRPKRPELIKHEFDVHKKGDIFYQKNSSLM